MECDILFIKYIFNIENCNAICCSDNINKYFLTPVFILPTNVTSIFGP